MVAILFRRQSVASAVQWSEGHAAGCDQSWKTKGPINPKPAIKYLSFCEDMIFLQLPNMNICKI